LAGLSDLEPTVAHVHDLDLPDEDVVVEPIRHVPLALRLVFLLLGLGLFVTALGLMKAGATELGPSLEGSVFTDNAWSTLGLGWLGACIVLSGSPIAVSALALLDGGVINPTQSFTMLTGSRLGAAFVVLLVGIIYALRRLGRAGRRAPISIGILSLTVTLITYVPGALLGYAFLESGALDDFDIGTSPSLTSLTDSMFGWAVDLTKALLPDWMLFPIGLGVLLVGFAVFDKVLPEVGEHRLEDHPESWYERKWPMFLLGCGACLLTLSVAVAVTLLVPLVAKGYLHRDNILPYVMGANITTLADTLVAAIVLGNVAGVRVVVAVTAAVTVWTLILLVAFYPLVRAGCLGFARWALQSHYHLAGFVAMMFAVPLVLIALP
jgi:solute carrier family 34 (sodium-dependent phosphate cotransporter)